MTDAERIVIMGFTGVTMVNFSDFHGDVERRLGRPVFTSEFPAIGDELKELYRGEFLALCNMGSGPKQSPAHEK